MIGVSVGGKVIGHWSDIITMVDGGYIPVKKMRQIIDVATAVKETPST